eukprot:2554220-Prymnesium_polylepis.1
MAAFSGFGGFSLSFSQSSYGFIHYNPYLGGDMWHAMCYYVQRRFALRLRGTREPRAGHHDIETTL